MLNKKFVRSGLIALLTLLISILTTPVWAHGGVAIEIDTCRIPVGDQWVHFTAYTPTVSADAEYCNSIPNIAHTNLVFDYEGPKLKKMTVEFEITKEPEGKRVYYQEPKAHKTGTINAVVDFSKQGLGAGRYLAHVTLVNEGKKIDAHLPFSVSAGGSSAGSNTMFIVVAVAGLLAAYFFVPGFRKKQEAT